MKYCTAVMIALGVCVSGCASKKDANEKNFGMALTQYLSKHGELCLGLNKWPADVSEMDLRLQQSNLTGIAEEMAALESVGVVSVTTATVDQLGLFGNKPTGVKFKVKRYNLTDAGKKFYREKEAKEVGLDGVKQVMRGDICYGKKILDRVVKWEGPIKLGDYQEANVKYLYKIDQLADWAKNPRLQAAFSAAKRNIDGAGNAVLTHTVKLTSEGWEANGLGN